MHAYGSSLDRHDDTQQGTAATLFRPMVLDYSLQPPDLYGQQDSLPMSVFGNRQDVILHVPPLSSKDRERPSSTGMVHYRLDHRKTRRP